MLRVHIGYDSREQQAYEVCARSLLRHASKPIEARPLVLAHLRGAGLYRRTHEIFDDRIWDTISDAPMSTEFALTRFLVPHLEGHNGWSLFCDADFLWRGDVWQLLDFTNPRKAVVVVPHDHVPYDSRKMDGQHQIGYPRKNWSSLILWNCLHEANRKRLTLDAINTKPGLWLHGFCWLDDDEIGYLPEEWNWLVGHGDSSIDPKAVHFTDGTPDMPGYRDSDFAQEWWQCLSSA